MDQRMPGRERDLPAGHAPDWLAERSAKRDGLRFGIVRVHDIEPLVTYLAA